MEKKPDKMATSKTRINLIKNRRAMQMKKTWMEGSIWDILSKK